VAFFNKTAPKVLGEDVSPIDSVKADDQMTSVHFTETAEWAGINKGTGKVNIFDPQKKGWREWTEADGERMKKAKADKADKSGALATQKESRQILAQINSIDKGIAFISQPNLNRDMLQQYAKDNPDMAEFVQSGKTVKEMVGNLKQQREELRHMYKTTSGRDPWKEEPKTGTELLQPMPNLGDLRFGAPGEARPRSTGAFRSLIGGGR
jgi:hypothetical protein